MSAPAPGRRAGAAGLVAGLAAMLLSSGAGARELVGVEGRCRVDIPDHWTAPDGRSPDGVVTIQIREVSSGRVFVNFQSAFGVQTLPGGNRDFKLMSAQAGNMTRYYAVTPARGRRACIAQVTSSRNRGNTEAETIARSLRRQER